MEKQKAIGIRLRQDLYNALHRLPLIEENNSHETPKHLPCLTPKTLDGPAWTLTCSWTVPSLVEMTTRLHTPSTVNNPAPMSTFNALPHRFCVCVVLKLPVLRSSDPLPFQARRPYRLPTQVMRLTLWLQECCSGRPSKPYFPITHL